MNDLEQLAAALAPLGDAPTPLAIGKALRTLSKLDPAEANLKPVRLGVISSFTFDPLVKPLQVQGYADGFRIEPHVAPFGQYVQELLNPAASVQQFGADVVLLAVRLADARPDLYDAFNGLSEDDVSQIVAGWKEELGGALRTFRSHSDARLLITNYEQPAHPSLGLADRRTKPSQLATIAHLNEWLHELAAEIGDAHVLDIDAVAARCGREGWSDPRLWFWARVPVAAGHHWAYAGEITRMLRVTGGKARKVLALDCDNTLWGGVLGDVGHDGIQLGHDFPGSAFVALQKRALELYRRGVVLIVASKNDPDNVRAVFENHPEMILRPEHIAYFGVGWNPKPENLRAAAETLNLGIDSFVFVDDHEVECAMMRQMLPQVLTVKLPEDPAHYERTLARLTCFDQLAVSAEDRKRGAMYRDEGQRAALRSAATDLESFYGQLEMKAVLACNDPAGVARSAQLTQRTNQFNMTTVRRTESQIEELIAADGSDLLTMRLLDRFGDNGIVGLAIVERQGDTHLLDTFLMSCRVLGRTVEQTFLSWIWRRARDAGATRLVGRYLPTAKNKPFAEFYESCGMRLLEEGDDGRRDYCYDETSDAQALELPPWIEIEVTD